MRNVLFLAVLFTSSVSIAQEREFPDIRTKKEGFARVQDKSIRSDLASFAMAGLDESAGKLPLRSIPLKNIGSDSAVFEGNGVYVKIRSGFFTPAGRKLGYYTNQDNQKKYLTRIDGKPYYGDYGTVPRTTIDQLTVLFGSDTVHIPKEAYSDLFNPIFRYNEGGVEKYINNVYLSADGKKVYIYMLKREAGGSYEVTWVIQDGKYLRRVVDFGFLKN